MLTLRRGPGRLRAFTLIELLVVIAVIAVLIGILLPALGHARNTARLTKDQAQVKSLVAALVVFSQNNSENYPLPSLLDKADTTVKGTKGKPEEKDNTGNIMSVLVYQGVLKPEQLISPSERSQFIVSDATSSDTDSGYTYATPAAAIDPAKALWDPGMAGLPDETGSGGADKRRKRGGKVVGSTSYAHIPPFGKRARMWQATAKSTEAVVANRGPEYEGEPGAWKLVSGPYGTESITLKIHGKAGSWRGNVGYNDGAAKFETKPDPDSLPMKFTAATYAGFHDNIFANEDDEKGTTTTTDNNEVAKFGNVLLRAYGNVKVTTTARAEQILRD